MNNLLFFRSTNGDADTAGSLQTSITHGNGVANCNRVFTVFLNDNGGRTTVNPAADLKVVSSQGANMPVRFSSSKNIEQKPLLDIGFPAAFSTVSFSLPQNHYTVPVDSNNLQITNTTVFNCNPPTISNLSTRFDSNKLPQITPNVNKVISANGGVFLPESHSPPAKPLPNSENVNHRPTTLFTTDDEPKVLVGNELLTPGKALQNNNALSTPEGRNLAALSPDTIDYLLNDDFQKSSQLEGTTKHLNPGRPASYPSLNSADLEDLAFPRDPCHVPISTSHRSLSFHRVLEKSGSNVESRDRSSSCRVTASKPVALSYSNEDMIEKKVITPLSFEFSPASFLKSLDETIASTTVATTEQPADQYSGGIFVPHPDNSVLTQARGTSVSVIFF